MSTTMAISTNTSISISISTDMAIVVTQIEGIKAQTKWLSILAGRAR